MANTTSEKRDKDLLFLRAFDRELPPQKNITVTLGFALPRVQSRVVSRALCLSLHGVQSYRCLKELGPPYKDVLPTFLAPAAKQVAKSRMPVGQPI